MHKHKIIVKQFRNKERIRASLGIERNKTIYQDSPQPEEPEDPQQNPLEDQDSLDEESNTFQSFLEGYDMQQSDCSYNPYDLFLYEAFNDTETPPPSKIAQINGEYAEKIGMWEETSCVIERRIRFRTQVGVRCFGSEEPVSQLALRQEMEELSLS